MPNEPHPFPLSEVLFKELEAIKGTLQAEPGALPLPPLLRGADGKRSKENELKRLRWIYDAAYKYSLSALCLSGGGIRSAAFSLGIIQALADRGLLQKFDYLSTVSGGGYIGAWLSARLHRTGNADQVMAELGSRRANSDSEAKPIEHLREYSSYLTPKVGLLSADTWAALAIVLRNMGLNWLILVPLICLPVILVKVVAAIVHTGRFRYAQWWSFAAAVGCCLLLALSIGYQLYRLYARGIIDDAAPVAPVQKRFLRFGVLPATFAGAGVAWLANQQLEHQGLTLADALLAPTDASSIWHELRPLAALFLTGLVASALASRSKPHPPWFRVRVKDACWIFLAWIAIGLFSGLVMWIGELLAPNVPSIWHGWESMAALGFFLYGLTALVASALARRTEPQPKWPRLGLNEASWNILAWAVTGLLWGAVMWVGVRLYWMIGPLAIDRHVLLVVFGLPWLLLAMRVGQLVDCT